MIVSREDLGDILSGDADECVTGRPPELGKTEPVRLRHGRVRCWVTPLEVWEHHEGGYVVRFVRAPAPHTPRLLARTGRAHLEGASKGQGRSKTQRRTPSEVTVRLPDGTEEVKPPSAFPKPPRRTEGPSLPADQSDRGYTAAPFRALGDEPECPPEEWLDPHTEELSQRDQALRENQAKARRVERWRNKRQRKRAA